MRLLRNNTHNGVPPGGFDVSQGGTQGLEGIAQNMKNATSGVPTLDDNGLIKVGDVPIMSFTYAPNLEGPTEGFLKTPFVFKITNYGYNRPYYLFMKDGTITRDHDVVTVVPRFPGVHTFKVNDREFLITVASGQVNKPFIESVSAVSAVVGGNTTQTLNVRASVFSASSVTEVHESTRWMVSTDDMFVNLLLDTTKASGDLRDASLDVGVERPMLFVRMQYVGKDFGESPWSETYRHSNPSVLEGLNNGDRYGAVVDISANAEKIIVGSPGYGTTEEAGCGSVSILRNTGVGYSEEASFSSGNQSSRVELNIPTDGSVRVLLDSSPVFDQTYTTSQSVDLPPWNKVGKFFGKGGPGTRQWVPPTPGSQQQGLPGYPNGLPPYVAPTAAQGNPSYPGGLPPYSPGSTAAQGNPSYPNGLPPYSPGSQGYPEPSGDPAYPNGLPPYIPASTAAQGNPSYPNGLPPYNPGNPGQGNPSYPSGLPPYIPASPQQGLPGYPQGLPSYIPASAAQGNPSYPSGLPSYIPASAAQGNPSYPSGLPPYSAGGPIYTVIGSGYKNDWNADVSNWPSFWEFPNSGYYEDGQARLAHSYGYLGTWIQYTNIVYGQMYTGGISGGWHIISSQYTVYNVTTGNAQGNPSYPSGLPPYSPGNPGQGSPSYPSGLPPYNPGNPAQGNPAYPSGLPSYAPAGADRPGYYIDYDGPASTATINSNVISFAGGNGAVPAVLNEKRFYANNNDAFGSSVALSKDYLTAVAGSPKDKHNGSVNAGSCSVFKNANGTWGAPIALSPPIPTPNALFGTSVDLSANGTTVFVGAPGENKVYVFKNQVYAATITTTGIAETSKFGERISCSNDGKTIAIASPTEPNGEHQGKVRVFKETTPNTWTLSHTLSPNLNYTTPTGTVPSGATLKIEQRGTDNVLLSTHNAADTWTLNNSTRSIRLIGNGAAQASYGILGAKDPDNPIYPPGTWGDILDHVAEVEGFEVFPTFETGGIETQFEISYHGNNYSFRHNDIDTTYDIPVVRYVGDFGSAISLSEDGLSLAVGAPASRIHQENQGFVSYYTLGATTNEHKLIGPSPYGQYRYGTSVALGLNGKKLLVTEPGRNGGIGSFDLWTANTSGQPFQRTTTQPNTTITNSGFGLSAAIDSSGDTKVFSNPLVNNNRGCVYVL